MATLITSFSQYLSPTFLPFSQSPGVMIMDDHQSDRLLLDNHCISILPEILDGYEK